MVKDRGITPRARIERKDQDFDKYAADLDRLSEEFPAPPFGCPGREQPPSAAPLPSCEETCTTCTEQYLPLLCQQYTFTRTTAMEQHDDATAAAEVDQLTSSIEDSLTYLRANIDKYGDTIMKRWHNRTSAKRTFLLLKAMPDMHKTELLLPEIRYESIRKCDTWAGQNTEPGPDLPEYLRRKARLQMLPYLTLETLSKDKSKLLALLHYRTAYHPSDWVMFDFDQVRQTFHVVQNLPVTSNPHCVVMQEAGYGRLVPWSAEAAHRFDIIGYPRARVILIAQSHLLAFLKQMVVLILDNQIKDAQEGREKWNALAEDHFRTGNSFLMPPSLCNSAFAPPLSFQEAPLLEMFKSQYQAAADELDQLQTDPVYTSFRFQQMTASPYYDDKSEPDIRVRHFFEMVVLAYLDAVMWHSLVEELAMTKAVRMKYGRGAEHDLALRGLHCSLEGYLIFLLSWVQRLLLRSKAFSYIFGRDENGRPCNGVTLQEQDMARLFRSDLLCWNIAGLCAYAPEGLGTEWHLECIDNILTHGSAKEKSRVDRAISEKLNYIAAMSRALTMFRQRRPHQGPLLLPSEYGPVRRTIKLYRKFHAFQKVTGSMVKNTGLEAKPVYEPLEKFLSLPLPGKKVDQHTWTRLEQLHASLAKFWNILVHTLQCWVGQEKAEDPDVVAILEYVALICTRQTDAFKAQLECERKSIEEYLGKKKEKEEEAAQASLESSVKKLSVTQTVWGDEVVTDTPAPRPRNKAKTRRVEQSAETLDEAEKAPRVTEPKSELETRSQISVTKASLAVFEKMFDTYSTAEGDVQWTQLVSALVDAGCSATPCGGSAVSFKDEAHGKGAVVLHRPHPDPAVDPIMLRSMGKRLAKWFGWGEGTFVKRVT